MGKKLYETYDENEGGKKRKLMRSPQALPHAYTYGVDTAADHEGTCTLDMAHTRVPATARGDAD